MISSRSKAHAKNGFMWSQHPEIARRWASEYGSYKSVHSTGKSPESESSESPKPKLKALPKLPGGPRDFSHLHPSQSARHTPKTHPVPNEKEAMQETGVQFLHGSRHSELGVAIRPPGLRGFHQKRLEAALSPKQRGSK